MARSCHDDPELLEQELPGQEELRETHQRMLTLLPESITGAALPKGVYFPGADRSKAWFSDDWDTVHFSWNRALVLHTTETSVLPGYQGGGSAPHITAVPDFTRRTLKFYQHYRFDESARALKNPPGGVNTNTTNVIQIELVGTCDDGGPGLFWPEAPDWALRALAEFVKWLNKNWGIPIKSTVHWKSYPASYGLNNGVRLTGNNWLEYHGILAHEHVAENDHGDVANWTKTIVRLIALCADPQEEDLPLNDADKAWIKSTIDATIKANLDDISVAIVRQKLGSSGPTVGIALQDTYGNVKKLLPPEAPEA